MALLAALGTACDPDEDDGPTGDTGEDAHGSESGDAGSGATDASEDDDGTGNDDEDNGEGSTDEGSGPEGEGTGEGDGQEDGSDTAGEDDDGDGDTGSGEDDDGDGDTGSGEDDDGDGDTGGESDSGDDQDTDGGSSSGSGGDEDTDSGDGSEDSDETGGCEQGVDPECNAPPVANAGDDRNVPSGQEVSLNGGRSSDPDGLVLEYEWTLSTVPPGSAAALSNPYATRPTFVTDLDGEYVATLVVTDAGGLASEPDTVTITAEDYTPEADAGANQNVRVGDTVALDGSGSSDPNGDALAYQWDFDYKPAGSAAELDDPTSATPSFTADIEGRYTLTLVVSDGTLTSQPDTTDVRAIGDIIKLDFPVLDAEYSNSLDAIVAVSEEPAQLHVYDPFGATNMDVDLPLTPTAVSVGPDGSTAAVGHDAWVSVVNLTTGVVDGTFAVTAEVGDVVLAGNGWAHAFPLTDQWVEIHSINIETGEEILSGSWSIRDDTRAKLHPSGNTIYGADNGVSPSDLEKYDVSRGPAEYLYDSPYHGDFPVCGDLWMAQDGERVFTRCGNVFLATTDQADDMTYGGSVSGAERIQHLAHSSLADRVTLIPQSWPSTSNDYVDTEVQVYGYPFLTFEGTIPFPEFVVDEQEYLARGRFVFIDSFGQWTFVIVQAHGPSGPSNDFGLLLLEL